MKNKWRILKILVTVILFGFLLSFSLKRFNNARMENVSINMNQGKTPVYFIDEKDIKDLVKQYNPTKKIGDVKIPELETKINENPFVDSANVFMNLNGNLNIDIKQRVPVFRLSKKGKDFYVDEKGVEFPISKNFSYPCMLVMGDVEASEYQELGRLIEKIDKDDFCKKYFIGIKKEKGGYNLLTSDGHFKVELGDLENIDFKVQGFKTFVEKYLVYQNPQKYKKVSVKYNNQIVTTLNPYFKDNDSMLRNAPKIEIVKTEEKPVQLLAATPVKTEATPEPKKEAKKADVKKESTKPKTTEKKSPPKKSTEKKKETSSKPSSDKKKKAKVIVE
ncbi:cell division protein FtsQ [Epilithonimonas bovis DSM 19482]|uniref:Cell division protein FtsQ n=1 Tax=Epilithonimonas bovis DSM 19482 TaxID=1121284 RepID=A0A1U7PPB6_9FLAO|nr:cell division protein FtsQ [Epilithonimonas bovis]SIT95455.1 cell division protein FtsQ [Epilithonimonas bovis DSM 19482]